MKISNLFSLYSLLKTGPLRESGWFRSMKEKSPVDSDGKPIPWYTYPAIEFLGKRVGKSMTVFEYGCGNSTIWWAERVREVVSVEHDKNWYERICPRVPGNVQLFHIDLEYGGEYSKKVTEYEKTFDIIIIDGRDRTNCARNSLKSLKPDGVVIWDNSDRQEYKEGYEFLNRYGFRKLEFTGLVPAFNEKSETGIFYRDNNCLSI
jgi:hypothetical protein